MKKFLIVAIGFLMALFMVMPSGTAATGGTTSSRSIAGIMNHYEYAAICTQYAIDQWGTVVCDDVWSQTKVENFCDCSGDKINSWTKNGHDFKSVRYFSPYDEYNRLTYRQWDTGDPWKAQNKDWRLGSICCYETG